MVNTLVDTFGRLIILAWVTLDGFIIVYVSVYKYGYGKYFQTIYSILELSGFRYKLLMIKIASKGPHL